MTLGFLYDNRQPQTPRLLVVEVERVGCRVLGVRRLSPCPDLRPVLRVWPSQDNDHWDVGLWVETGPGALSDDTNRELQSLLTRITW